jgi:hypothetical protein
MSRPSRRVAETCSWGPEQDAAPEQNAPRRRRRGRRSHDRNRGRGAKAAGDCEPLEGEIRILRIQKTVPARRQLAPKHAIGRARNPDSTGCESEPITLRVASVRCGIEIAVVPPTGLRIGEELDARSGRSTARDPSESDRCARERTTDHFDPPPPPPPVPPPGPPPAPPTPRCSRWVSWIISLSWPPGP